MFLDLEMTGLHPDEDRIVEVCARRLRGFGGEQIVEDGALSSLVRPDVRGGGGAEFHGLDEAALADAPPFDALVPALLPLLDGAILVAHGARVDVAFLEASFARAGSPRPIPHFLDTVVLARRAFAQPSYALSKLAAALGIDPGRAHRAADDVATTVALFERLIAALAPRDARELWAIRAGVAAAGANMGPPPRPDRAQIVTALEEALARSLPIALAYRPSRRPEIPLRVVPMALHEGRLLCRDAETFGRRELLVARILRAAPPGEPGPA